MSAATSTAKPPAIRLQSGDRAAIVGRSGQGKTVASIILLHKAVEQLPIIIFDTKGDLTRSKSGSRFLTFDREFPQASIYTRSRGMLADNFSNVMIYRPDIQELNAKYLDGVLMQIFRKGEPCTVYLDEVLDFHKGSHCGDGLTALLTRGRALGISTVVCTQRPARISLHILSEASWFCVFDLALDSDRKRMADVSGQAKGELDRIPPRHFLHIENGRVTPRKPLDPASITPHDRRRLNPPPDAVKPSFLARLFS